MATPELKFKLSIDDKEFTGVLDDAGQRVNRFGDSVASSAAKAGTSVQGLTGHLSTMGHAAAGAFAIGKLTAMTDAYASLNARVSLASQGIGSAAVAQQRLFEIAEKSRVGVEGLSEVYSTLAKAGGELGFSQARVLGITETLSKAMTLSGGSADSARAAMVQFGQGLQAGTLRGDELNSVLEQAPRLAQALAEGLGKPVGALKAMAEQGQITTEAIFTAMERMKGKIDTEFEQLPTTVGQAMTVMQNSLLKTIGVFDQAGGVSRGFADGIMTVSKNMDAAVIGAAAVGTAYVVLRNSTVAATVATQGLALAQGALGGPIGLIATALGVAATAWVTWKATATQSEQTVQAQVAESDADIVKRIQGQIDKLRERNQLAGAPIPKGENQNSLDAAGRYTEAYAKWQALISGKDAVVGASEQTVVALLAARNERIEQAGKDVAAAFSLYDNLNTAMTVDATAKTTASREKFMESYASSGEKLAKKIADYDKEFAGKVTASQRAADIAAIKAAAPKAAAIKVDESLAITARLIEQSRDRTEQFAAEGQGQEKLTEGQKLAIKITGDLEKEGGKLNGTQRLAVMTGVQAMLTQEAKTIADKKAFDVEKQLNVMREKSTEEYIRQLDARALADADVYQMAKDYGRTVEDANARTQVEIGLMGETAAARQIALSQYDIEIKLQQKILDIKSKLASLPAQDEAIAIATAAAATEKAAVSSRVYVSDLTESVDQYDNIFREGFAGMINGGQGAWKSFTKSLATTFKTSVADQIYKSFAQPFVVKFVASMLGVVGGGLSGAANAAGAGGSIMEGVNSASSFASMLNGGITSSITAGFGKLASSSVGQSLGLSNSAAIAGNNPSAYIPAGGELTSFGATASSWASTIGGTMAGIAMGSMAKKMISGGYSVGSGMESFQNIGIAVGSYLGGPVVGAIVGAAAGVFNRAFGRKLKDSGIEGSFGGQEGFSGNNYEFMKGGWFRSDKTNRSAMDPEIQKGLADQFKGLQVSSALMAQTLGLSADSVAGFTANIKLSFKDLTEDQINEKLALEFGKVSDSLAQGILGSYKETVATVIDQIATSDGGGEGGNWTYSTAERQVKTSTYTPSEFAREGETASQTLTRLSTSITLVNGTSEMLGNSLFDVGLKGANTASLLVDAFGGAEAYAASMGSYYQNFYRESERTANLTATTAAAFTALGKTMPVLDESARAVYRALVDEAAARDMTVESNRAAYASLIALQGPMNELAPAFATVAESAPAASTAVSDLAAAMQKVTDDLQSQGASLQAQWDKLALSDADYRAKQIAGMSDLQVAQYDTNTALQASIDAFASTATAAAAAAEAVKATAATLADAQATLLSGVTTRASDAMASVTRAVNAQKATDAAALEAQKAIATAAYTSQQDMMQVSINATTASLGTLSDSVGKLKSLSTSLKSALDGMRIAGSEAQYRAAAQAQLSAALQAARSGGGLPLDGQLDSALRTISQPSEALYGSFEAYARDFYATANDIAALAELTDTQLTEGQVAESLMRDQLKAQQDSKSLLKDGFAAQVSALDDILVNAQLQLDIANGINTSVLTIPEALAQMASAISGLEMVRATQGLATTPGSAVAAAAVAAKPYNYAESAQGRADQIREYMVSLQTNPSLTETEMAQILAATAQSVGVPESEIASAWGATTSDTRAWFAAAGVPQFAQGINYVPGDMDARIHEGEAVIPKAFNPYNPNARTYGAGGEGNSNSNAEFAAALRAMAARLDAIEANTRATAGHAAATDRKLARVIPGNAVITQVATA